jgi:hypothetical protein
MDKYLITLKNFTSNEIEEFTNSLHLIGTQMLEDNINTRFLGLGNTSLICKYLDLATEGEISFAGEIDNTPFAIVFMCGTDINSMNNFIDIFFALDPNYINSDILLEEYHADISIEHSEKCKSINCINPKWLPNSIKTNSDWNNFIPGTPGYIKNKICEVLSYENSYENYLNN